MAKNNKGTADQQSKPAAQKTNLQADISAGIVDEKAGEQPVNTDHEADPGKEQLANAGTVEPNEQPGSGQQSKPAAGRAISMERWNEAQEAERKLHTFGLAEGIGHYQKTYQHYFAFVQLGFDLGGLSVVEVGPADFPALRYCKDFNGIIVEPMPSEHLQKFCDETGVQLITEPLENIESFPETTELWLFNVMQHIIDPDAFVEKCKQVAKRIRFFEPINYPVSEYHPHTYTIEDFQKWFGDCVQLYQGGSVAGFHQADCAYGVFIQQ